MGGLSPDPRWMATAQPRVGLFTRAVRFVRRIVRR